MKDPVFVDLDSTLCDTWHRHGFIGKGEERKNTNWTEYSMLCGGDKPIAGTVAVVNLLHAAGHPIVILSGRSKKAERLTYDWLNDNGVCFDYLILREETDRRRNGHFKVDAIERFCEFYSVKPALLIDDYDDVMYEVEKIGVATLLVNPNYPTNDEDPDGGVVERG